MDSIKSIKPENNTHLSFDVTGAHLSFDVIKLWSATGSSRKGTFYCPPVALVKLFGKPNDSLYCFDGKVDAGYILQLSDPELLIPTEDKTVEIYCYKATSEYDSSLPCPDNFWASEEIQEFSISGQTAIAGLIFSGILNSLLMSVFYGMLSEDGRRRAIEKINVYRRFDNKLDKLLHAQESSSVDCSDPDDDSYREDMDGDHGSALASAGFGTDEDYGDFGGSDDTY